MGFVVILDVLRVRHTEGAGIPDDPAGLNHLKKPAIGPAGELRRSGNAEGPSRTVTASARSQSCGTTVSPPDWPPRVHVTKRMCFYSGSPDSSSATSDLTPCNGKVRSHGRPLAHTTAPAALKFPVNFSGSISGDRFPGSR